MAQNIVIGERLVYQTSGSRPTDKITFTRLDNTAASIEAMVSILDISGLPLSLLGRPGIPNVIGSDGHLLDIREVNIATVTALNSQGMETPIKSLSIEEQDAVMTNLRSGASTIVALRLDTLDPQMITKLQIT